MSKLQRVLIIGAGITGLTAAVALRRAGSSVEIVEIRQDVAEQPGVGLSLLGNALGALGRVGLAAPCLSAGVPANHLNTRRPDGTLIARSPVLPMGGPAYPGVAGIRRKDLHSILLRAVAESGASLQEAVTVQSFQQGADDVEVTLSDGRCARYDLLVAADGLYSRTRAELFPECTPVFDGQAVWRAGVPRLKGNDVTELHFGGPFGAVGLCPVSDAAAYLYIVDQASRGERHEGAAAVATMRAKLDAYSSPLIRAAAEHLAESTSVSFRLLESLLIPDRWYQGRVLVIGDAAHCGPPVLAQGAAMGIEDAVVLGELAASELPVPEILDRFMQRRLPRAELVVRSSRQLCEWEVTHQATPELVGKVMLETNRALSRPF
jgi:2-polyprenyl-6-methoxyphenol hydroxylase-like FAD-dependent oxidoreductase